MGKAKLVCGPANLGKTSLIVRRCLELLDESPIASFTLILPTNAKIKEIKERLLRESPTLGVIGLRLFTLLDFAREYLRWRKTRFREVTPIFKTALLSQLVRDLWQGGRFSYFETIANLDGFARAASSLIAEFKENEITPQMLKASVGAKRPSAKDLEILAIYEAYQARLSNLGLSDREDLFLLAKSSLEEPASEPPFGAKALFIDGFYDFNHIQLELIKRLIELSPETIITLQYEAHRAEVFSLPEEILKALEGRCSEVVHLGRDGVRSQGLERIEKGLFRLHLQTEETGQPPPVTIISAHGLAGEITEVAREIKRLAFEEGFGAGSFCVAFRNFHEYAKLVEEIFPDYGIPFCRSEGESLASSPLVKAFLAIISAPLSGYERQDVLKLFHSPYIKVAKGSLMAEKAEVLARQCGVIKGRRAWENRLNLKLELTCKGKKEEVLENGLADVDPQEAGMGREFSEAEVRTVRDCVLALFDCLDELLNLHSVEDFRQKLLGLIEKFEIGHSIFEIAEGDIVRRDLRALLKLREAIEEVSNILSLLKPGQTLTLRDYARSLSRALDEIYLSEDRAHRESVLVTDINNLRQLHFPVVFICGLIEGEFPRAAFYNPIYRDDERSLINKYLGAQPLNLSSRRRREERILFYNAATRATRRLYLTYPSADAEGKDKTRSYYLDEIEKMFQPGMVEKREIAPAGRIPEFADAQCETDFRRRAFKHIFPVDRDRPGGAPENWGAEAIALLRAANRKLVDNIFAADEIERSRSVKAEFGPWEGNLNEPAIRARLKEQFGPDHLFSPSKLNLFGTCPFLFMCLEVWGIRPFEDVEIEVPPMEIGRLYHEVLCEFYRRWLASIGGMPAQHDQKFASHILKGIIDSSFSRAKSLLHKGHRSMLDLEKEKMRKSLEGFLKAEIERFQENELKVAPRYFEVGFGMTEGRGFDPISVSTPLTIELGGESLKIAGVIDRVDIADLPQGSLPHDKGFILIDYKTGQAHISQRDIEQGRSLQLPIYALALKELILKDYEPMESFFYNPKTLKKTAKLTEYKFAEGKFQHVGKIRELVDIAKNCAAHFSSRIREGRLFLNPSSCPYNCSMSPLCRYEKRGDQLKKGEPGPEEG